MNRLFSYSLTITFLALAAFCQPALAQKRPVGRPGQVQVDFTKGYFLFPIRPGKQNYLNGNMGELRSNHFHGGLDIRTEYRTDLPVYAAAEGYIEKAEIESNGYGKLLIMRHPNGLRTVYAHLNSFEPKLANWVREQQYRLESFVVSVSPPRERFYYKKGEVIALSGNTGASKGPHLHFEIRDSLDGIVNPLLFDFPEIKDTRAPYFARAAFRPLAINGRVENQFERKEFAVHKVGRNYAVTGTVKVWGTLGLELMALDRMNDGSQRAGITCMDMQLDGKDIYFHSLAHLSDREARQINNHLVYDNYVRTGSRFQKCYVDDGNELKNYRSLDKLGKITIFDDKKHTLTVNISDAHGNSSTLTATLLGNPPEDLLPNPQVNGPVKFLHRAEENTLLVTVRNMGAPDKTLTLFSGGKPFQLSPAYRKANETMFLWDLRKGVADSVRVANCCDRYSYKRVITTAEGSALNSGNIALDFITGNLFDTLYMEIKEDAEDRAISVHNPLTPLQSPIGISMKPLPGLVNRDKTAAYLDLNRGKMLKYIGGKWDNDVIKFHSKVLGRFTLATDNIPPTIKVLVANRAHFKAKIYDNRSGIASWRATLNGKFLLMMYEHKQNMIFSETLIPDTPLSGKLELSVTDNMGNVAIYTKQL
ncbi:MAG: M23 family metallopeptidase [Bacteroidota bacterium]